MSEFILKNKGQGTYVYSVIDDGIKGTVDPDLAKSFRTRFKASAFKGVHGLRNFEIVPIGNEKDSAQTS